jgi:kinesin family protein 5
MESELNELKVQLEKVSYENKEGAITMDSLRESNLELSAEVESLKVKLKNVVLL